ncbi:MAG: DUF922 domain-containing protein [Bacteroidetes bacterium]|nr:MAG: DUF922 domain-containing protein [Bacteroidota bacterium]
MSVGQNIKWNADSPLVWEDFQGPVDASSRFHAQTQSGVKYSFRWQSSYSKTTYTFEVFSYCDKSLSWVKSSKATDKLLAHEQLHFDISELHARKLKQTIAMTTFTKRYDSEIKNLFKENQRERELMQEQYDRETEHMKNRDNQLKWQQYVAEELNRLEKYTGSEIVN